MFAEPYGGIVVTSHGPRPFERHATRKSQVCKVRCTCIFEDKYVHFFEQSQLKSIFVENSPNLKHTFTIS